MKGWYGNRQQHGLASKGIKTAFGINKSDQRIQNIIKYYKNVNKWYDNLDFSQEELDRIDNIAQDIIDNIPEYTYHRVNWVDFMNMVLKPENTPRILSTSSIYLTQYQLEKTCIRSERDVSIKLKHWGCPVPLIYDSPFEDEEFSNVKEDIMKELIVEKLHKKYKKLCPNDLTKRDIHIGGNYRVEHEIFQVLSDKTNLADKVEEIIVNPSYNLYGIKYGLKSIGHPELIEKVRFEKPEDEYELEQYIKKVKK